MGSMSLWHWIIVAGIIILLFGRGRISDVMGDLAKGIKSFKQGMAEDDTPPAPPMKQVTHNPVPPATEAEHQPQAPSSNDQQSS